MTAGAHRGRVADAIAELAELRTADPAAQAAIDAVKLTQLTLETLWATPPDATTPPPHH